MLRGILLRRLWDHDLAWSFRRLTACDGLLCTSLGLILGGTLGNFYDRAVFGGVRDFLYFHWKDDFKWPVFNVADCCLVCGAFLLLTQAFWAKPATNPAATTSDLAEPASAAK